MFLLANLGLVSESRRDYPTHTHTSSPPPPPLPHTYTHASSPPSTHTHTHTALIDLDLENDQRLDFISTGLYDLGVVAASLNVICWFILVAVPFVQVCVHGLVAAVSSTLLRIFVSITSMYQSNRYTVYPEIMAGTKYGDFCLKYV